MCSKWYGSAQNRIDEGKQVGEIFVGMGATEMMYSDREPYTVQKIISPSRVIVTPDKYERIDSNGVSECQEYKYESVPLTQLETEFRCTHLLFMQTGPERCGDVCERCNWYKETAPTNGITLIKTKLGWKVLGQDRRFLLGIRRKYEDPSF